METILKYLLDPTEEQRKQSAALHDLYIDWDTKINVTLRRDIKNLYEHHALHSLGVARVIQFRPGTKVMDLGAGGEFPDTPLVILSSETKFHLIDGIDKKVRMAVEVANVIRLKNATFRHTRAKGEKQLFDSTMNRTVILLVDLIKIIKRNISPKQQNAMPNELIYLKGGGLEHEAMPLKHKTVIHSLSENFEEEFLETKKVVYSQIQESGVIKTMKIKRFEFNASPVGYYALWDDIKEVVVVDPGCFYKEREQALKRLILTNELAVKYPLNAYLHLDHILGNPFILKGFGPSAEASKTDESWIDEASKQSRMFGFQLQEEPVPLGEYLYDGDIITFGHTKLETIHVSGCSPDSLVYYYKEEDYTFLGDVLLQDSIGCANLSGDDFDELIDHICSRLFVLPNETAVYPGHGVPTTTGVEKAENPFFR